MKLLSVLDESLLVSQILQHLIHPMEPGLSADCGGEAGVMEGRKTLSILQLLLGLELSPYSHQRLYQNSAALL